MFEVGKLIDIWQQLMAEKEQLGLAIGKAKAGRSFNLDAAVDANKSRRAFLITMQQLANRKSSHELQKGTGRGYVFNNDGNQTTYCYDDVSMQIDEALLQTKVDYEPKFDLAGENSFILEEMYGKIVLKWHQPLEQGQTAE